MGTIPTAPLRVRRGSACRHDRRRLRPCRTITRLTTALGNRLKPPCEAIGSELKVLTPGRVRYPDASVVCEAPDNDGDIGAPTVVFEVVTPSSALTDRTVKASEYASVPGIMVYVIPETERPELSVRRRAGGWEAETVAGPDAELALPEVGITIPLAAIYTR